MKKVLVYIAVMVLTVILLVVIVNAQTQNVTKGNVAFKIVFPATTLKEASIIEFIIRHALKESSLKSFKLDVYFDSEFVELLNDKKEEKKDRE